MKIITSRFKKNLLVALVFSLVVLVLIIVGMDYSFAQPGLPTPGGQEVPIDGGLGILAALGGAYAVKKLREKE